MFSTVDLCILCLTYDETRKSMFSQDNEGIDIEQKCRFILNDNVNIRPEVSYICLNCLKNLNYVYYFKHMCLQNIKTYNNYMDTLDTRKDLKVTLTDLEYQKKTELMCNNEAANEISPPIEVVTVKEEIADNCLLQDANVLEGKESIEETDEFSTPGNLENLNIQCRSSLNEEHHIIEHFLNRVEKETGSSLIPEEIQIKDECLFEANNSDSEDISNNILINEGTNKPDNFIDELNSEHSTADDDKKTSKNCNSTISEGGENRRTDQNVNNSTYSSDVKGHNRTHTRERTSLECTYECDVCNRKFTINSQLRAHKRTHNIERPFKCSVCEKAYTRSDHLSGHMAIHTGEKPFQCQICQYKCAYKSQLKIHMRIHTGEKPYHCQVCQYKCAKTGGLKEHMRTHTGEKPYHCQVCQYKCAQAGTLKEHMLIHTGENPFHCQLCQYECKRAKYLKIHMRIHTGEKPFTCKHCQKAFSRSGTLKVHMQTHQSDKI